MIPREILKKIRQIELRTNRVVTGFAARGRVRIPTGFRLKAQGCAPGATLGPLPANIINRNAVAAMPFSSVTRDVCHNPVGVGSDLFSFPQVARFSQPWAGGHNPFGIARIAGRWNSKPLPPVTFHASRITHHVTHDPPRNP
jgi:hypothetical protein